MRALSTLQVIRYNSKQARLLVAQCDSEAISWAAEDDVAMFVLPGIAREVTYIRHHLRPVT